MLLLRLIYESFSFAANSLAANKLRTILSLLGVTIGIFAIISVFTVIDSLEGFIRDSLNSLGSNMVYVQKMPWTLRKAKPNIHSGNTRTAPVPTLEETDEVIRRAQTLTMPHFCLVLAVKFSTVAQRSTTL